MALRYWVGGTDNWDATAGTKWALTSGGAGGQAVPTTSDDVFLDGASGNNTITKSVAGNCKSLTCNGFTGTLNGSYVLSIYGACNFTGMTGSVSGSIGFYMRGGAYALTLDSGMTWTTTGVITSGYSAVTTLNTNGKILTSNIVMTGGGGVTLAGNLEMTNALGISGSGSVIFRAITYNVKVPCLSVSTTSLYMGSGTWEIVGVSTNTIPWNIGSSVALYKETSTLKITDNFAHAISLVFNSAVSAQTYNDVIISRGNNTYNVSILGPTTFHSFKDEGTEAHSLLFNYGKTFTFDHFLVSGSSGKKIKINSTTTGSHNLVLSGGGLVSSQYLDIQHSVASPADTWFAGFYSTNNQEVTTKGSGWNFTPPPVPQKNYLGFF